MFNILSFDSSMQNIMSNIYLLVILNIFFIIATYTDITKLKIYNKFNLVMLITRIITFIIFGFNISYVIGGILIFMVFLVGAIATNAKIGGDIKFAGNIGLWIGFWPSVLLIVITIIVNIIYRIIVKNKGILALAPFFYASFIIMMLGYFIIF